MVVARTQNSVKAELTRDMLEVIQDYFSKHIGGDEVAVLEFRDNALWLHGPDGTPSELVGLIQMPAYLRDQID